MAEREADVWIPDDLSWAAVARGGLLADDGDGGSGTVLATSPIYMVTDTATAARLTRAGGSWLALSKLVASPDGVRLAVRDPNGSGDGMVAAGTLGEAVWIKDGMDASSAALSAALRQTRTVSGTGPALPSQPGEVGLVPEYVLLSAKPTTEDAAVLAGTDHTAVLRYGWLPTAAAVADPVRKAGAGAVAGRAEEPERGQGVRGGRIAPAQRRHRSAAGGPSAAAADRRSRWRSSSRTTSTTSSPPGMCRTGAAASCSPSTCPGRWASRRPARRRR